MFIKTLFALSIVPSNVPLALMVIVSSEVLCANVIFVPAINLTSSFVPVEGFNLMIASFPLPDPVDDP